MSRWLCFQIGAREHYAVARGFHRRGLLQSLVTDAWVGPTSPLKRLPGSAFRKLGERYHPELADAAVRHFTGGLLSLEGAARLRRERDVWAMVMRRNAWFQARAVEALRREVGRAPAGEKPIVFTYSYAAGDILRAARELGCPSVLCEIDPGIVEENIVAEEHARRPELKCHWERSPERYWQLWREEHKLADHIVANSDWSREALAKGGVDAARISVVPLIYDNPRKQSEPRAYPDKFSADRPLRLLFLGSIILRKGVGPLMDAMRLVKDLPVEFRMVGHMGIDPPADLANVPYVRWIGLVPRSETERYYREADLFLFPTLSDGFGLTQLEARSRALPQIVSRRCGEVTVDGHDGIVLAEPTAEAIAAAIRRCLESPRELERFSRNTLAPDTRFLPDTVIDQLELLVRNTKPTAPALAAPGGA